MPRNLSAWIDLTIHLLIMLVLIGLLFSGRTPLFSGTVGLALTAIVAVGVLLPLQAYAANFNVGTEAQLRNAMSIGEGKWSVFAERPVSVFLLIVIAAVLILPRVLKRRAAAA